MSENIIRIGVLGCANIASRYVVPAILNLPNLFELTAVASRNYKKAKKFTEGLEVTIFDSYDKLISSSCVDAVYIPLPNALHYKWIRSALKNKKHVLVEKSLACSLNEVIELTELANEGKLALVENFQFRFHSQLSEIKEIVRSGVIGNVRNIRSSFGFPPFEDSNNIRYSSDLGGGALLDAGAYPIKLAQELLGDKVSVDSAVLNYNGYDVDIWGAAQLSCKEKGIPVQASFGFDNFYQCSLEIWGSKGMITAERIFTSPPGVEANIVIKNQDGTSIRCLPAESHFENMLTYFHSIIDNDEIIKLENKKNVIQSQLLCNIRDIANVNR